MAMHANVVETFYYKYKAVGGIAGKVRGSPKSLGLALYHTGPYQT